MHTSFLDFSIVAEQFMILNVMAVSDIGLEMTLSMSDLRAGERA
jgi:hypothetical protein